MIINFIIILIILLVVLFIGIQISHTLTHITSPSYLPKHQNPKRRNWWKKKWNKNEICPISRGRFRPTSKIISLNCGHRYHKEAWLTYKEAFIKNKENKGVKLRCPLCRQICNQAHKVF